MENRNRNHTKRDPFLILEASIFTYNMQEVPQTSQLRTYFLIKMKFIIALEDLRHLVIALNFITHGKTMKYVRFRDLAGFIRNGIYRDEFILFGNEEFDPENVSILPPVMPTKIVGVGLNYADHAEETGSEPPDRPMFFLKPPNTVTGHEKVVTLPFGKERVDYEGELGVVIGQQCRNVKKRNAMDVVWGFTCVNDISNRDDQPNSFLVRTKAFDNAAPMGPVIATPDEVPQDAHLELRVNGEIKQNSTRSQLIFSIPELIEEITGFMTLEPGDVISTGTPAGVGPLRDGDTVEIEIEGIGTLKHYVKR